MSQKWAIWASVFLYQACSNTTNSDEQNDIADSATPTLVKYKLSVAGPLDDFVEIIIDGKTRNTFTQYLRIDQYAGIGTRVESHHKETGKLLSSVDIHPVCASNTNLGFGDVVTSESQIVCVSPNGYISGHSDTCCSGSDSSGCVDTFCPQCSPLSNPNCPTDEHCSLVLAHEGPLVVHIRCVSQGTIEVGQNCSFATAGPDGVDQCVAGSGCIDNTCREFCSLEENGCELGFTCATSPLLASVNRLGACMPPAI